MHTVTPSHLPDLGSEHRVGDEGRAFRKAGPAEPLEVTCDYCGQPAQCVTGATIYPHRSDLSHKRFWSCCECNAYVGCHPPANSARGGVGDGTVPLGRLANAQLRRVKQLAHEAFDPLFRDGEMTRREAYKWLAGRLGISNNKCHMGSFDEAECWRVIEAVGVRQDH